MAQSFPIWPNVALIGPEWWPRVVAQSGGPEWWPRVAQKGPEWRRVVPEWTREDLKCTKVAQGGTERPRVTKVAKSCQEWTQRGLNITQSVSEWSRAALSGLEWFRVAQSDSTCP